jgi:hypothetical protein
LGCLAIFDLTCQKKLVTFYVTAYTGKQQQNLPSNAKICQMSDNFMPTNETPENQGLKPVIYKGMPTDCQDNLPADCHQIGQYAKDEFVLPPYTGKKIQDFLQISERTFYRYLSEIKEAWFWLAEADFREGKGYSVFTLDQMKRRNSFSSKDEYVVVTNKENAEAIANWKASQLPQPQSQPQFQLQPEPTVTIPEITGGLMNLPSLVPVESIVPQGQTLSTDDNPSKDLAVRSNALSEGLAEIENLKNFLKGASAVADTYIENLEKTTEEEERQAKEIEELAFELEVKADYIKRAEVRKAVINKESSKTRTTAESKVANFADFFVKRSNRNASS